MLNNKKFKLFCIAGIATLLFAGCGENNEEKTQQLAVVDEVETPGMDVDEADQFVDDKSEEVQSFFDGTDDRMNTSTAAGDEKFPTDEEKLAEDEKMLDGEDEDSLDDLEAEYADAEVMPLEEVSDEDIALMEESDKATVSIPDGAEKTILDVSKELTGKHHVSMVLKDYGTIEIEVDADAAPITATNFIKLVQEGFYDGLTFHRIVPGFIVQGGDPDGNGTGGSSETIKGEFASNGIDNPISHKKGVISMARTALPDSASSQFFIMLDDKGDFLDGEYAAFGQVTSGMEYVEKIAEDAIVIDNNGTVEAKNQPSIESASVID